MNIKKLLSDELAGDILGGLTAMLIALPSAIAFAIILFFPLGPDYIGKAAVAGIIGTVILGLIAPLFGGTPRLITAPCAPAAAVVAIFITELIKDGSVPYAAIPFYVALLAFFSGMLQFLSGCFSIGKFFKYIPYPVVAGYLNGVGILILLGQMPEFLGLASKKIALHDLFTPSSWRIESILVGTLTMIIMLISPRIFKKIPSVILALFCGMGIFFLLAFFNPSLLSLTNNPLIIGKVPALSLETFFSTAKTLEYISSIHVKELILLIIPTLTLSILLSIDTLKTCVILDVLTQSRHNSNKELLGQGLANMASSMMGGIPGSGATGPTLINITSGAKSNRSSILCGIFSALVLFFMLKLIAWIPLAALSGVLIMIAIRMLDKNCLQLLKYKATLFDFFVILAVVVSAVFFSLVIAAGVGTFLAIILFLREQIRSSVVRRKFFGHQKFSKKRRSLHEQTLLETQGKNTLICELQGPLFFGTTDRLFTELEPHLSHCRFIVLDMRRVSSLDFTGANMLRQIHNRVKELKGYLILASIPLSLPTGQNVRDYLLSLGFDESSMNLKFYADLDSALEWIEEKIIHMSSTKDKDPPPISSLSDFEFFTNTSPMILEKLHSVMEKRNYKAGEKIFSIGDRNNEIYFLCKGVVKINLPLSGGINHHLLTLSQGDFFGEMAFLDKGVRSAEATSMTETTAYLFSRQGFEKISQDHPEVCGIFFERLAHTLAERLRLTNIELISIEES